MRFTQPTSPPTDVEQFTLGAVKQGHVWVGERSWKRVAILAREQLPILTRLELPGDDRDRQAPCFETAVRGVLIPCIHLSENNHPIECEP